MQRLHLNSIYSTMKGGREIKGKYLKSMETESEDRNPLLAPRKI